MDEPTEPVDQTENQTQKPILRGEKGQVLPGSAPLGNTAFKPGVSGNPTGKACGPVRALHRYLEGEAKLPASFEKFLPPEVWKVYEEHGLGAALVCAVMSIALNPEVDSSDRLKAIDWCTARFDGPLVKQLNTHNLHMERREVIIVGNFGDERDEDPEFPPEVTDIEEAEEAARQEANLRRQEALGMAESKTPPKSSGRRRKRAPGENGNGGDAG